MKIEVLINLKEAANQVSMINFIKPGKVIKILDKSANIYIILLIFTFVGIFLSIIYFFGIAGLNKKKLTSLLRQV